MRRSMMVLASLVALGGCGDRRCDEALTECRSDLEVATGAGPLPQWIDLTRALTPGVPISPGGVSYMDKLVESADSKDDATGGFSMGAHTGTHLDAPAHFVPGQPTVDEIPLEALTGRAILLDVSEQVEADADYQLTVADLEAWQTEHGRLDAEFVLVRTGWGARWPDEERYRNADDEGTLHVPGLSEQAIAWFAGQGVRGMGLDTLSIDHGAAEPVDPPRDFLGPRGFRLENLAHLERLREGEPFTLLVAPLPLVGTSGAPARVFAYLD